jgi:hypothetical protein
MGKNVNKSKTGHKSSYSSYSSNPSKKSTTPSNSENRLINVASSSVSLSTTLVSSSQPSFLLATTSSSSTTSPSSSSSSSSSQRAPTQSTNSTIQNLHNTSQRTDSNDTSIEEGEVLTVKQALELHARKYDFFKNRSLTPAEMRDAARRFPEIINSHLTKMIENNINITYDRVQILYQPFKVF